MIIVITFLVLFIPYERSGGDDTSGTFSFFVSFLTLVAIYAIFTLGLNIQWGYTGVFNFGVLGFFMLGAYTAAIITKAPAQGDFTHLHRRLGRRPEPHPRPGDGPVVHLPRRNGGGGHRRGHPRLLVSIPTLRLREDYLAIATIGIAELLRRIVIQEDSLVNGTRGLTGIPHPLSGVTSSGDYKYLLLGHRRRRPDHHLPGAGARRPLTLGPRAHRPARGRAGDGGGGQERLRLQDAGLRAGRGDHGHRRVGLRLRQQLDHARDRLRTSSLRSSSGRC